MQHLFLILTVLEQLLVVKYPTTEAGAALAWEDTGTADIRLTVTNSAATTAGEVRVTILYAQNNNLS